ncbi:MAG: DUF2071 domain-containing protein [Acidobacteria bacterium]|nr:DUF2071 domain-containing protein [Acidobacteriota bacterium]
MHPVLESVAHRPCPLPDGPWVMEQTWNDLLFAHWPLPPQIVRPLVPPQLPIDMFEGRSWIAVTPFHMSGVRVRGLPPIAGLSDFPELNVRTYVTVDAKPGVFFFSLDAGSRLAAWAARATYHLPYFFARMRVELGDTVRYRSIREPGAQFRAEYRASAPVALRKPGSLEHWLTERYCLYTVTRGKVFRAEIHHRQWPLQDAEAEISENTLAHSAGIELAGAPSLLHYSKKLEVLVWRLKSIDKPR